MANLNAVFSNWATVKDTKEDHDADHFQAFVDAVIAIFDSGNLIELYPYLLGNPRLQKVLQTLDLPLEALKVSFTELDNVRNKTDEQQKRQALIKDIIIWLSQPEHYSPLPEVTSYNDTALRERVEEAMRAEVDQVAPSKQGADRLRENSSQVEHLQQRSPVVMASHDDRPRQIQHYSGSLEQITAKLQNEIRENFNILSAQISSLKDSKSHPQPSQAWTAPQAAEEPTDQGTASILSDQDHAVTSQQTITWSPEDEAALKEARAQPHQKANAYAALQHPQKLAKYMKLQTWGEAYNIIIDELVHAAGGGSSPSHLKDLNMPDAHACYYRLH
ncbi:hypothetical protein SVAN01_02175 [Stagonosporopsis vannaccii]|nr:hypothetical protein SVAN01_02175 [Stagonosporopsis vannaccii]